ncbi:MAG: hypothetical protein HUU60_00290 [Armatimonadetes bacterium]|nr:hypothetical protein [Armatimonadota bacterium]
MLLAWMLAMAIDRATFKTEPFLQDIAAIYTIRDGLPSNVCSGIGLAEEGVIVQTDAGRAVLKGDRWQPTQSSLPAPLVASGKLVWEGREIAPPDKRAYRFAFTDHRQRLFAFCEGELMKELYRRDGEDWVLVSINDHRNRFYDDNFLCAAADPAGFVWIGTRDGLLMADGDGWWKTFRGEDGVPIKEVRCIAVGPNGDVWIGSSDGAARLRNGRWSFFWGRRWMPGNDVRSIAIDSSGVAYLATEGGVARIESRPMTLQQKADHYEAITAARHNRNGYVTVCEFENADDPSKFKIEASDNDGLWTALYCAAQSYRYAVTGDPTAKSLAQKSMRAIRDLERLTGISGFPARSVIRKDETNYFQSHGEWHESPVDPNYIWKGDTSSDELDGHFYVLGVYHDLVADDREKSELQALVRRIIDHLLSNNYRLIDKDGKPTRWAIFDPESINDDPIWEEERGLNSLSMLSYLLTAHHMTGDPKYRAEYEKLIHKHRYLLNAIHQKALAPFEINHSDDELAWLGYYRVGLSEKAPAYRKIWMMSLERSWQIERPERSPFTNFIFGAITGQACDVEASVRTLQEWPWDLRDWAAKNSHRADVTVANGPGRFGEKQSVVPVSYAERAVMQWNGNPYRLDGGGSGKREHDGAAFLLPYWMGRYYKIIE